jgi:hypothetical protein
MLGCNVHPGIGAMPPRMPVHHGQIVGHSAPHERPWILVRLMARRWYTVAPSRYPQLVPQGCAVRHCVAVPFITGGAGGGVPPAGLWPSARSGSVEQRYPDAASEWSAAALPCAHVGISKRPGSLWPDGLLDHSEHPITVPVTDRRDLTTGSSIVIIDGADQGRCPVAGLLPSGSRGCAAVQERRAASLICLLLMR